MSLIRLNLHPSRFQLSVFSAAWFVVCAAVSIQLWRHGHHKPAITVGALSIAVPLVGIGVPEVLRWLYIGLSYATYPIGFVVSHLVLAIVYFVVVTPIGLVMRVCGYDPLERKFDAKSPSYWKVRRTRAAPETYFRQS